MPTRVLDFDKVVLEAVAFFAVQPLTAPFPEAMPKSPGLYERLLRLSQPTTFFFLKQCWLYLLFLQEYQLRTACSIANQVAFDLGASNFLKRRKLSP